MAIAKDAPGSLAATRRRARTPRHLTARDDRAGRAGVRRRPVRHRRQRHRAADGQGGQARLLDPERRRRPVAVRAGDDADCPTGRARGSCTSRPVGAEIRFSGPWGKLFLAAEVGQAERLGPASRTLMLATDTGVTAMLGLVRSRRFAAFLGSCVFVWLRTALHYFLPDELVRSAASRRDWRASRFGALPPPDHPERIPVCRQLAAGGIRPGAARARVHRRRRRWSTTRWSTIWSRPESPRPRDSVESFFNMPKKAASPGAT